MNNNNNNNTFGLDINGNGIIHYYDNIYYLANLDENHNKNVNYYSNGNGNGDGDDDDDDDDDEGSEYYDKSGLDLKYLELPLTYPLFTGKSIACINNYKSYLNNILEYFKDELDHIPDNVQVKDYYGYNDVFIRRIIEIYKTLKEDSDKEVKFMIYAVTVHYNGDITHTNGKDSGTIIYIFDNLYKDSYIKIVESMIKEMLTIAAFTDEYQQFKKTSSGQNMVTSENMELFSKFELACYRVL